jgi:PAS domain S-box-containing protein
LRKQPKRKIGRGKMLNHDFPYAKEIFETIIENAYVWIVIVDAKGKIIYMNENYCRFCEVSKEEAIGRHVTEVIENWRRGNC